MVPRIDNIQLNLDVNTTHIPPSQHSMNASCVAWDVRWILLLTECSNYAGALPKAHFMVT